MKGRPVPPRPEGLSRFVANPKHPQRQAIEIMGLRAWQALTPAQQETERTNALATIAERERKASEQDDISVDEPIADQVQS
jgi:hypothetical protein